MRIDPPSKSSSMLMHRSIVVLPEPLEPIMLMTSPGRIAQSTPFRTSTAPYCLWRPLISRRLPVMRASRWNGGLALDIAAEALDAVIDDEIEKAGEEIEFETEECAGDQFLGAQQQFRDADDRQEGGRFHHLGGGVDPGGQNLTQRLGPKHIGEGLPEGQADRLGR